MAKKRNQRQRIYFEDIIKQNEELNIPIDIPINENEFSSSFENDDISDEKKLIEDGIIDVMPDISKIYKTDVLKENINTFDNKNKSFDFQNNDIKRKVNSEYDIIEDINFIGKKNNKKVKTNTLPSRNRIKMANQGAVAFFDWTGSLIFALIITVLVFVFAIRVVNVNGESMLDTLHNNDKVLLSNLYSEPEVGDIVVISKGANLQKRLIKRVIALEGQTIDIDPFTGRVTVDNVVLDEDYIKDPTNVIYDITYPLQIPDGYAFVMGDNRLDSKDSRNSEVGLINLDDVIGIASAIIYPFDRFNLLF